MSSKTTSGEKTEAWGKYAALCFGPRPPKYLFLHANGFNGGTYRNLLHRFADEDGWAAPDFRGHGGSFQPGRIHTWADFVADVDAWRSAGCFDRPTAIGHSLGGMTALLAEARRPGTFEKIVLLDPVIFAPRFIALIIATKATGVWQRNPLVKGAKARRAEFPNREAVLESYGKKSAFAKWERAFLEDYVRFGFHDVDGGVRLACPGEIEAQIFSKWPLGFWFSVSKVKCPVLILRGANSDTFSNAAASKLERRLARATRVDVPATGHFLPMERPDAVAQNILKWERGEAGASNPQRS